MEPDLFKEKLDEFLINLAIPENERNNIQEKTAAQSDSIEWHEIRRKRIGSSLFGKICNMLSYTSCEKTVSLMLYITRKIITPAITWGKNH